MDAAAETTIRVRDRPIYLHMYTKNIDIYTCIHTSIYTCKQIYTYIHVGMLRRILLPPRTPCPRALDSSRRGQGVRGQGVRGQGVRGQGVRGGIRRQQAYRSKCIRVYLCKFIYTCSHMYMYIHMGRVRLMVQTSERGLGVRGGMWEVCGILP